MVIIVLHNSFRWQNFFFLSSYSCVTIASFICVIDIEVRDASRNMGSSADKDKSIKLCEARVPLSNIGSFKCYKLSKGHSSSEAETAEVGRVFIRINRLESELLDSMPSEAALNYFPLCKVLDANHPLYRHLYVDVNASPDGLSFYNGGLPGWFLSIMQCAAVYYFFCRNMESPVRPYAGPSCGELAIDRYANVEVNRYYASL